MVAKLIVFLVAIAALIVAASYLTYRYYENEAQREHERRMARDQRDYDEIMEYAEADSERSRERERDSERE